MISLGRYLFICFFKIDCCFKGVCMCVNSNDNEKKMFWLRFVVCEVIDKMYII